MVCACAGWEEDYLKVYYFINFFLGLCARKDIFTLYLGGRERRAFVDLSYEFFYIITCCSYRKHHCYLLVLCLVLAGLAKACENIVTLRQAFAKQTGLLFLLCHNSKIYLFCKS